MPVSTDYLDLDIWLARRGDGRVFAYAHAGPGFLTASGELDDVIAETRAAIADHATATGRDVRVSLRPSYRPEGLGIPGDALPVPLPGSTVLGRLVVAGIRGAGPIPSDPLGAFLAKAQAGRAREGRLG